MRSLLQTISIVSLICVVGCARNRPVSVESRPHGQAEPQPPMREEGRTALSVAPPMPDESVGLYLEAEARKGPNGAPYMTSCNVNLSTLNNSSISMWMFPKITFYAEQDGEFYPLRVVEDHAGGVYGPHSRAGSLVSLPRPPRPGTWKIFAIQEHSEIVYQNHLKDHSPGSKDWPAETPLHYIEDQGGGYYGIGMWTNALVSNVMVIRFAELSRDDAFLSEKWIDDLVGAGQYKPEFRHPRNDPRKALAGDAAMRDH